MVHGNFSISDNINLAYPFYYRPMFDIMEDGWQAFRPEVEFNQLKKTLGAEWRISQVNKHFNVGVILISHFYDVLC